MKEFIEKLIGRLEESTVMMASSKEFWNNPQNGNYVREVIPKETAIEIVNQLAEEYKDKTMIDEQYCWQTCGATEHCKECNRLGNGSTDYYENLEQLKSSAE